MKWSSLSELSFQVRCHAESRPKSTTAREIGSLSLGDCLLALALGLVPVTVLELVKLAREGGSALARAIDAPCQSATHLLRIPRAVREQRSAASTARGLLDHRSYMASHQWAATRMWEGLIGPSTVHWLDLRGMSLEHPRSLIARECHLGDLTPREPHLARSW